MTPALLLALAVVAPGAPQGPIDFDFGTMSVDTKARRVTIENGVVLVRQDFKVTGARAVLEYAEAGKPGKGAAKKKAAPALPGLGAPIQRFTVEGQVHVERGGRTADGDRAVFEAASQTLTLTGPAAPGASGPVLRGERETLWGERVVLHLESDDVEVTLPRLSLRRSALPSQQGGPALPTTIEAKRLSMDPEKNAFRFQEQVLLVRGDLKVKAPSLLARMDGSGEVQDLLMEGGVELAQGTRRATGRTATYDAGNRTVRLTGDPRLTDRGDELRGERIELQVDTQEVRVEKARGRLRPELHRAGKEGP